MDTLASGVPLVTSRNPALERLEREQVPVVLFDESADGLARSVHAVLDQPDRHAELERRSIEFAREKMDIYRVLERILCEQVVPPAGSGQP